MRITGTAARTVLAIGAVTMALSFGVDAALAKGCIKGAVVGGIAGHVAGHHGLAGAAVGCAIGHHEASKDEKANQQKQPE
jgi:hypothetical protein